MKTKPGDVFIADLGMGGKVRPVMVVSREDHDPPRALVVCVPITTVYGESLYEVKLPKVAFLRETSYANTQGLITFERHELQKRLGSFSEVAVREVKAALRYTLDL